MLFPFSVSVSTMKYRNYSAFNVASYLDQAASRSPSAVALCEDDQHQLTFAELDERVTALSEQFVNTLKLRPGDRVALFASNRISYIEVMLACWRANLVVVPINFQLHPEEVDYIVNDSGAKLCLAAGEALANLNDTAKKHGTRCVYASIDDPESWSEADSQHSDGGDSDLAWLFYTSGTTGKPKGVMISHENLRQMVLNYFTNIEQINGDDSIQHYGPLSHASGFYVLPHLMRGATNVVVKQLSPTIDTILMLAEQFGPVTFFMAPTSLQRLVADIPQPLDTNLIRTIATGGGTLHVPLARRIDHLLPGKLAQVYGQGESPMTISVMPADELRQAAQRGDDSQLRSVGRAFSGIEVSLRDEKGGFVEGGAVGEIVVRGPTVMKGYWQRPEATEKAIRDGWLYTGDIGSFDEQGYLTLLDRSKGVVISGGMNIYSREIEDLLMDHPAVHEVAIVGVPDPEWGEAVVACIALVPSGQACDEDLDALCLQHLARFKRPKRYVYFESLPKNNYGKILKRELREKAIVST